MATYYSDRMSSNRSHAVKSGSPLVGDVCEVSVSVALVNNDIIKLFTVPKGARVLGVIVNGVGVQSGTDSVFEVGDSGDTDRLIHQSGGITLRSNKLDNYLQISTASGSKTISTKSMYTYTADTDIEMKIITAGTGMTTGGKIVAAILYYLE